MPLSNSSHTKPAAKKIVAVASDWRNTVLVHVSTIGTSAVNEAWCWPKRVPHSGWLWYNNQAYLLRRDLVCWFFTLGENSIMLCVPSVAWLVHTTIPPQFPAWGAHTRSTFPRSTPTWSTLTISTSHETCTRSYLATPLDRTFSQPWVGWWCTAAARWAQWDTSWTH